MNAITEINIPDLNFVRRGKVRDIFDFGENLLIVASDRISAFDYIMPNGIPDKGKILTQISNFWFDKTNDMVKNHLVATELKDYPAECQPFADQLEKRSMFVHKSEPLPVECIVRGYITGSGWKDYQRTGAISGIKLPEGLIESERLDEPIFTPSTKSDTGHDENISFATMKDTIGNEMANKASELSIIIYDWARKFAEEKGIIIADTKFEFGIKDGELILIDEVLTPDSSRFWPMSDYQAGRSQKSFDKQYVRDYLESIGWEKQPPVPTLPEEVVANTRSKYMEALRLLTDVTL